MRSSSWTPRTLSGKGYPRIRYFVKQVFAGTERSDIFSASFKRSREHSAWAGIPSLQSIFSLAIKEIRQP